MDNRDIEEMFSALGPVAIKRMFGGKGVYFRGLILAVEVRDVMLLKADARSAPEFEAAGATQWSKQNALLVDRGRCIRRPRRHGPLGPARSRGICSGCRSSIVSEPASQLSWASIIALSMTDQTCWILPSRKA